MTVDQPEAELPCDVDALMKGDRITREQLVPFLGVRYSHKHYERMALAFMKKVVEPKVRKRLGAMCVLRKGEILVCTDSEAMHYIPRHMRSIGGQLMGIGRNLANIDVSELSYPEREAHERYMRLSGHRVHSWKMAGRRDEMPVAEPCVRPVPGLRPEVAEDEGPE